MKSKLIKALFAVGMLIVLILASGAVFYYGYIVPKIRAGKKEGVYAAAVSRPSVAAFKFDTGSNVRSVSDLKGKVVLFYVWATWCAPCIEGIPHLAALRNKYQNSPVEIIGLSVDDKGWDDIKPFVQKHSNMNYTLAVPNPAPNFQLSTIVDLNPLGDVSAIPTIFVVDGNGRLAGKFVGAGRYQEVDDLITKLLSEKQA